MRENAEMSSRVGIITQARTTSTRLPEKIFLKINGKSLIDYHIDRLKSAGLPMIVATTTNATDQRVVDWSQERGLSCSRGSETDVLSRFFEAAASAKLDHVVRVTSDCPLIDGDVIHEAVEKYLKLVAQNQGRPIYYSNVLQRTFPRGLDFEIFSFAMLKQAHQTATTDLEREHVTPFFYKTQALQFQQVHHINDKDLSAMRLTVDEKDDFSLMEKLLGTHKAHEMKWATLQIFLAEHPELLSMNTHVEQKKLEGISFRRADERDCRKIFDWRNDPDTRKNSLMTDEISWESHQAWFQRVINHPQKTIYMALKANESVGWVRVEKDSLWAKSTANSASKATPALSADHAEASWLVSPDHRGQGIGSEMLDTFFKQYQGSYWARVKKDNASSLKMAAKVGLTFFVEDGDFVILKRN